jgi:hypothetical protein
MMETHRLAQLVIACWRLSGENARIPTSHGVLDRALKTVVGSGGLPEWARRRLHFVDSRIGLQCIELPSILEWAQRSQLTSAPNPSYETTEVQISDKLAEQLLQNLDVSDPQTAIEWGKQLRNAVAEAEESLATSEVSRVEEY